MPSPRRVWSSLDSHSSYGCAVFYRAADASASARSGGVEGEPRPVADEGGERAVAAEGVRDKHREQAFEFVP